jgi:CRISPR/Cas system CSM-associated protein Csm3 (group 7 of RAMP superfamily)
MKNTVLYLQLDIRSYWRAGSGQAASAYADQLVIKQDGLPFLPGRQLRGILKKAFQTACDAGWFGANGVEYFGVLFGNQGSTLKQGMLQVSNAELPEDEINWFELNPSTKPLLYHTRNTQAIEHNSGTTKQGSLRTMEVTVPMRLIAEISLNNEVFHKEIATNFENWLISCCSLVTVIGAERNRGLGQVVASVVKSN